MSSPEPDVPTGFWSRQSRKDRTTLLAFGVQIAVTLVLLLVSTLSGSHLSTTGRLALLTGNIVALVASLQFAISRFFDDQQLHLQDTRTELTQVNDRMSQTLDTMESIAGLGETYIKIFKQPEAVRDQYQSTLDAFLRRLSNCIDDRRSGELDVMAYYGVLEGLAAQIDLDRQACIEQNRAYTGGIWALSFLLDNEWDDSDLHELKWFETLQRMDAGGVPTNRLWAFDKKMRAVLKTEPVEEEGRELIRRLALYCAEGTQFPNTVSFALPKEEILDEHVRLFGKGFFAAAFSTGDLSLIRGVCFDNLLSSNSLGGEIDYDEHRIGQIRLQWGRYLALAKPLKDYLRDIASDSAAAFMDELWTTPARTLPPVPHAQLATGEPDAKT